MTARYLCFVAAALLFLGACSEPDDTVMGSTSDGGYELTLSADPNWVRPDASLPLKVTLLQHDRSAPINFSDQITFTANNGNLSPTSLSVTFTVDPADSTRGLYTKFVTFRAGRMTEDGEGEIHGFFRDAKATLKVRIVPLVSD
jgi:hypothetical protein